MLRTIQALATLGLLPFTVLACSKEPAQARNTALSAAAPENIRTLSTNTLRYPAGVTPSAPLALNSEQDPQPTHHTLGDMLCPLIADGWKLSVSAGVPNRRGNESNRLVKYQFVRPGDKPILFVTTRFEMSGKPPIEMLNEIKTGDRSFLYGEAWPFLNEIFSQRFPECAA